MRQPFKLDNHGGPGGDPLDLNGAVFQSLGAASLCWDHPERAGVFDSTRCQEIGVELLRWINGRQGAFLGYATTRELLEELVARMECTPDKTVHTRALGVLCEAQLQQLTEEILDYRTVGSH